MLEYFYLAYASIAIVMAIVLLFLVGYDMDGAERKMGNIGMFIYPLVVSFLWPIFIPIMVGAYFSRSR